MTRVYLSGAMGGRPAKEVIEERQNAAMLCVKFGLHPVDPGREERKEWGRKVSIVFPKKTMASFVQKDLMLIRRCDVLLVLTGDTPSDGTWIEKTYAKLALLPVVMVAPQRFKRRLVGWSNMPEWTDAIFPTMESALKFIAQKWGN